MFSADAVSGLILRANQRPALRYDERVIGAHCPTLKVQPRRPAPTSRVHAEVRLCAVLSSPLRRLATGTPQAVQLISMLRLASPHAPIRASGTAQLLQRPAVRSLGQASARHASTGARQQGGAFRSRIARHSSRHRPTGGPILPFQRGRRPCQAVRGIWTLHGPHKATNTCQLPDPLPLAHGGRLREVTVKWEQWGDPTLPGDRTVVVMPSFSHGSHVCSHAEDPSPGWWQGFVGPGCPVDTNHFRVIAASILGSPFGTTGPATPMPETPYEESDLPEWTMGGARVPPASLLHRASAGGGEGQPITHYGPRFPVITPADQAACQAALLDHLCIPRVHAIIGGSLGGMQVLQFAAKYPERASRAIAISCTGRTTPVRTCMHVPVPMHGY